MTVLPEPDDSIYKFLEQILRVTLLRAGYTIGYTQDVYNYQFKFEKEDQIFDLTFQNAVFSKEAGAAIQTNFQTYAFSVKHFLQLSESNARMYIRDYIRNVVLLNTSEYREIILLSTAAGLYYKSVLDNRKDLMYVVTSEWARFLAGIPLPEPSALFNFLKELCVQYVSRREDRRQVGNAQ